MVKAIRGLNGDFEKTIDEKDSKPKGCCIIFPDGIL
jgi:hypothetical protein